MRHHQTTEEQKTKLIELLNEICKQCDVRLDPTIAIQVQVEGGGLLSVWLSGAQPKAITSGDAPLIESRAKVFDGGVIK